MKPVWHGNKYCSDSFPTHQFTIYWYCVSLVGHNLENEKILGDSESGHAGWFLFLLPQHVAYCRKLVVEETPYSNCAACHTLPVSGMVSDFVIYLWYLQQSRWDFNRGYSRPKKTDIIITREECE